MCCRACRSCSRRARRTACSSCRSKFGRLPGVNVATVACLSDNYAYLIWQQDSPDALVVDPSEHLPVLAALKDRRLNLMGILCTHHHWDHIGGVEELCRAQPGLAVYCSDYDVPRIKGATRGLRHAESFDCIGLHFDCMRVPGHTLGALAYCAEDAVFTGDTLFGAGCGRLFEGTPAQMHASLTSLASLADDSKVYFGHEYTRANLAFAQTIETNNPTLRARQQRILAASGGRSTPSSIKEERDTNPFLRCAEPSVRRAMGPQFAESADYEVFAELRRRKDGFRA